MNSASNALTLAFSGSAVLPLDGAKVTIVLPVADLDRARDFYEQQLGLPAARVRADGKPVYLVGNTEIELMRGREQDLPRHVALSFHVADITIAVTALEGRGVRFADYDLPGMKTVDHVCRVGDEYAAWFEDSEGNLVCLHQNLH
jgi:predicted enzyme related to lactoylglutathione lyase